MGAFPIDFSAYKPVPLGLEQETLTDEQEAQIQTNIGLMRAGIVFFTAHAGAKGLGGHTGGAYDMVPEMLIADGFMRNPANRVLPVHFDEAGHRVAAQYMLNALDSRIPGITLEDLLHHREHGSGLHGHPEFDPERGIFFNSGRLGHLWSFVNGIATMNPDKRIVLYGTDGAQQEGNDAEAARSAVARALNVNLFIDDNGMTITDNPEVYLPGFDVHDTLKGHGLSVDWLDFMEGGEDLSLLHEFMRSAILEDGPTATIIRRPMAPGIEGVEGTNKGHDCISKVPATTYLLFHGHRVAAERLMDTSKSPAPHIELVGSEGSGTNRKEFGVALCEILDGMSEADRLATVRVIDSDLAGSVGLNLVAERFPEIFIQGGIKERDNFSTAAGVGSEFGMQGIYATFSAFLEMLGSEITMARLRGSNVLAHFSHAGVDWMGDDTCHFGVNNFFADGGLGADDLTRLYFPADALQMRAVVRRVYDDLGLRFIFSTRSSTPYILDEQGRRFFDPQVGGGNGKGYQFVSGKADIIRGGIEGFVVSYGDMLHRSLEAVTSRRADDYDVGLVNMATLNLLDEAVMEELADAPFVLVVESQNRNTGLGIRLGTELLKRGFQGKYDHLGVTKPGAGGIHEQIPYQGLAPHNISEAIHALL